MTQQYEQPSHLQTWWYGDITDSEIQELQILDDNPEEYTDEVHINEFLGEECLEPFLMLCINPPIVSDCDEDMDGWSAEEYDCRGFYLAVSYESLDKLVFSDTVCIIIFCNIQDQTFTNIAYV